ncbi:MAG: glycosyltransferase family A protein [Candidatus Eremiobacterota bacterium]
MDISIIICTYNRANLLKFTLEALLRQSLPPEKFEVIIVDDSSVDDTFNVYSKFKIKFSNVTYLYNSFNIGLPLSRNRGIEVAAGEHVLFTDDDCIPSEKWVETMSFYLHKNPVVGGSVETPLLNYLQLSFICIRISCLYTCRRNKTCKDDCWRKYGISKGCFKRTGWFF